ncbi:MAG: hypothetical protein EP343_09425 [Deltaproteobacteria bacterium]|nr:MAG: hypothetical protein EP343_09425 [Deltaproteobacteria bacterium]
MRLGYTYDIVFGSVNQGQQGGVRSLTVGMETSPLARQTRLPLSVRTAEGISTLLASEAGGV